MLIDPANPVVALCAEGMQLEGTPSAARDCFERAWAIRKDDFDATVAAHFLARHQESPEERLRWNRVAVEHALVVGDQRIAAYMSSLYLNLGDSHLAVGDLSEAAAAADSASVFLDDLPEGGYRTFVTRGINGLKERIREAG